jgi:hypothetical protein
MTSNGLSQGGRDRPLIQKAESPPNRSTPSDVRVPVGETYVLLLAVSNPLYAALDHNKF